MIYDKASWHYNGDYPKDLPIKNAATHMGMFLAWCIENNLYDEDILEEDLELTEEIQAIKNHTMTGAEFLMKYLDESFNDDDLNDEGNAFATWYYSDKYLDDYGDIVNKIHKKNESIYAFPDTFENYALVKERIDKAFKKFQKRGKK